MRKRSFGLVAAVCAAGLLTGCGSDEPKEPEGKGYLIVHLQQDDADADTDFSEYSVAIIPEQGFIYS